MGLKEIYKSKPLLGKDMAKEPVCLFWAHVVMGMEPEPLTYPNHTVLQMTGFSQPYLCAQWCETPHVLMSFLVTVHLSFWDEIFFAEPRMGWLDWPISTPGLNSNTGITDGHSQGLVFLYGCCGILLTDRLPCHSVFREQFRYDLKCSFFLF